MSKPLGMKQRPKESCNYVADSTYFILREKSQLPEIGVYLGSLCLVSETLWTPWNYIWAFSIKKKIPLLSKEPYILPPYSPAEKYSCFRTAHQPASQPRKRRREGRRREEGREGKRGKWRKREDWCSASKQVTLLSAETGVPADNKHTKISVYNLVLGLFSGLCGDSIPFLGHIYSPHYYTC